MSFEFARMSSLILIPGLAGNRAMWRDVGEALAPCRPAITDVHMRHDSIPEMAAALLREHAGPLVLAGASMGGMIAMEAARQAPERIVGLALLGTNAAPETAQMRVLRENAIVLFAAGRMAEIIEPNVALAFHPDNATALSAAYLEFVDEAGAGQLIRQNRAVIARPDAREHLPQVRCPVLVMCGEAEADQLTPPAQSHEIAALVPHAKLVMVPKAGHMLTMEQPAFVAATLDAWLAAAVAGFPPARE